MNDRQKKILRLIEQNGQIELKKLAELFSDYSIMTIRRDLIFLEKQGHLIRVHGGAVSRSSIRDRGEENAYAMRSQQNVEAKIHIAQKAAPLVMRNRAIYFDAGTTVMQLALLLQDDAYTIITSALNTALELIKKPSVSVIVVGGHMNANTLSCSGSMARRSLVDLNIDSAFMSASGFSTQKGFTVSNSNECELKTMIIEKANRVYLLIDTDKFDKDSAFTFAKPSDIDAMICEGSVSEHIAALMKKNDVKII